MIDASNAQACSLCKEGEVGAFIVTTIRCNYQAFREALRYPDKRTDQSLLTTPDIRFKAECRLRSPKEEKVKTTSSNKLCVVLPGN